jgi:hypothetical protein
VWSARSSRRASRAATFSFAATLTTCFARAGGPLGSDGERIQTSDYAVDLFQGPVLASTRITALGGAFTAIAEGPDGIPFNPAAASLRAPYSTTRDDYDLTASITLPASVEGTDFDNDGKVGFAYDDFIWLTAGGIVQSRHVGFGLIGSFQNYELGSPGGSVPLPDTDETIRAVRIRVLRLDPVVSYGFLDGQLHVGTGLRFAAFYGVGVTGHTEKPVENERLLMNANALGAQGGLVWAPFRLPLRLGAALRSPVVQTGAEVGRIPEDAAGDRVVGDVYLPDRIVLPWELEGGVAIQLWKRPLNIAWRDEDEVPESESKPFLRSERGQKERPSRAARRMLKARYRTIPRERVLLSASALLSGPVANAVGLESMLSQTIERSGERIVLTLRGGVEAEVVP